MALSSSFETPTLPVPFAGAPWPARRTGGNLTRPAAVGTGAGAQSSVFLVFEPPDSCSRASLMRIASPATEGTRHPTVVH